MGQKEGLAAAVKVSGAAYRAAVLLAAGLALLTSAAFAAGLADAERLIAAGKWVEAEQVLAQIAAANPQDFRTHLLLGKARYKQAKLSLAAASLKTARSLRPDSSEAAQLLGYVRFAENHYSQAISLLTYAKNHGSDDALTRYRLGLAYAQTGQLPRARDVLHDAALKYTQDAPIAVALAQIQARLGNTSEAAYWYRKAAALRPADTRLLFEMIDTLMAAGDYLRAESALKSHLGTYLDDVEAWRKLGEVYEKLGLAAEAQGVYLRLEQLGALLPGERLRLLQTYMRQGDWAAAATQYEKMAGTAEAELHAVGGEAYMHLGRWDDAVSAMQKAVALSPTTNRRRTLANAYSVAGRYQEAYAAYRDLLRTETDADLLVAAADAALRSGDTDAAVNLLARLAATAPDEYQYRALIADTAEQAGDLREALTQWYVAAGVSQPNSSESRLAMARLGASAGYGTWALDRLREVVLEDLHPAQLANAAQLAKVLADEKTAVRAARLLLSKQHAPAQSRAAAADLLMEYGAAEDLDSMGKLWRQCPQDADLSAVYAQWLLKAKRYPQAIEACRQSIAANPQKPELYSTLIEACAGFGRLEVAAALIGEVLACDKTNPAAADFVRVAYERANGVQTAADEMVKLLRRYPQSAPLQYSAARALESAGRWTQAAQSYRNLIAEYGRSAAYGAASCYAKSGLYAEAQTVVIENLPIRAGRRQFINLIKSVPLDASMRLLGAEPESVDFYLTAGKLYAGTDVPLEGAGLFEFLASEQGVAQARAGEAWILYKSGDYTGAVIQLQQLPAIDLVKPQVGLLLAECYLAAGNFVAAMQTAETTFSDSATDNQQAAEIAGQAAAQLDDAEGALAHFAHALTIAPSSAVAADGIESLCRKKLVPVVLVRRELSEVYRYADNRAPVLALGSRIAAIRGYEDLRDWVTVRRGLVQAGQ